MCPHLTWVWWHTLCCCSACWWLSLAHPAAPSSSASSPGSSQLFHTISPPVLLRSVPLLLLFLLLLPHYLLESFSTPGGVLLQGEWREGWRTWWPMYVNVCACVWTLVCFDASLNLMSRQKGIGEVGWYRWWVVDQIPTVDFKKLYVQNVCTYFWVMSSQN